MSYEDVLTCWMNLGQQLKVNAAKYPNTTAFKDSSRSYTYPRVNKRVNRLAHSLMSLGLKKCDKVAVLMENVVCEDQTLLVADVPALAPSVKAEPANVPVVWDGVSVFSYTSNPPVRPIIPSRY